MYQKVAKGIIRILFTNKMIDDHCGSFDFMLNVFHGCASTKLTSDATQLIQGTDSTLQVF